MDEVSQPNLIAVPICAKCHAGEKGECHFPGCIFWSMRDDEIPKMLDIYATSDYYENQGFQAGAKALRDKLIEESKKQSTKTGYTRLYQQDIERIYNELEGESNER